MRCLCVPVCAGLCRLLTLALADKYVNLDDCWEATTRAADGSMQADPDRFTNGTLKVIADWLHEHNFLFGMCTFVCEGGGGCLRRCVCAWQLTPPLGKTLRPTSKPAPRAGALCLAAQPAEAFPAVRGTMIR